MPKTGKDTEGRHAEICGLVDQLAQSGGSHSVQSTRLSRDCGRMFKQAGTRLEQSVVSMVTAARPRHLGRALKCLRS